MVDTTPLTTAAGSDLGYTLSNGDIVIIPAEAGCAANLAGSDGTDGGNAHLDGGTATTGSGGGATVRGGDGDTEGGYAILQGGNSGVAAGGDVFIRAGSGAGGYAAVFIQHLPTADPVIANALWNDTGTLKISAG